MIRTPIIIDPPDCDQEQAWQQCQKEAEQVYRPDGEVNWRAAFGADPGACSCPMCSQSHWNLGLIHRCTECGFEYPTNWWWMLSWGVAYAQGSRSGFALLSRMHDEYMAHPYYRYGVEHPDIDPWNDRHKINWRDVLPGQGSTS